MPKTDKEKRIQKVKEERVETAGALVGVKLMQKQGFFPDDIVSSDEEARKLLQKMEDDSAKELESFDMGDIAPITEYKPGKTDDKGVTTYPIATKAEAVYLMEVIQRENDEGEMIPMYAVVGNLLSINRRTIRQWWMNRKSIMKVSEAVTSKLGDIVKRKLEVEILRMVVSMSKMDYEKMSAKDFFTGFKTVLMQHRILEGKSTSNVEHKHSHHGSIDMVPSDDM